MITERNEGEVDPRAFVYDLLEGMGEEAVPHVKKLFVMAGQIGMAGAYFFEKDSADYLRNLQQVDVMDAEDNHVVTLPSPHQVIQDLYVERADWVQEGETYHISEPEVNDEDRKILYDLRAGILSRLINEGLEAPREFLLIGTAMGGEEDTAEDIAQDLKNIFQNTVLPQEQIDRFFTGLSGPFSRKQEK